jgi:hypothetical protein
MVSIARKLRAERLRRYSLIGRISTLRAFGARFAGSTNSAGAAPLGGGQDHQSDPCFWNRLAAKFRNRQCAFFLTSTTNERVIKQFERLRTQARGYVDVFLVINSSPFPVVSPDAKELMPLRWAAMISNGGAIPGYLDTLWMPLGLSAPYSYVWMIEFDVDYSGEWSEFFRQFKRNRSDLLTTTLTRAVDNPEWCWWKTAAAPTTVKTGVWHRDFHPIMRLSQRFMRAYVNEMLSPDWGGHYEFTLPTVAIHLGMRVEDIGRDGLNYTNTRLDSNLSPGTFIYRPIRTAYFHERPETFDQAGFLYHPVKPDRDCAANEINVDQTVGFKGG